MLSAALLSFALAGDEAYEPPPATRLYYSNATFVRYNPLGMVNLTKLGLRKRLSSSDHILLQDTYAFVGGVAMITPAYSRIGVYAESQLLSVFRVFGEATGAGYYGSFDQAMAFEPTERFSDDAIEARGDEATATTGWTLNLGGTVRAAVGPVAIRSTTQVLSYNLALEGTHFYDQYFDRLAPLGGFVLAQDNDVLYVGEKLRLGLRHTLNDTLGSSVSGDAAMTNHRLGPLFAWQFQDKKPGAGFNQPTLFVISQWWLQHPYRTGDEQPQALPLIATGFAFNGDLWTK